MEGPWALSVNADIGRAPATGYPSLRNFCLFGGGVWTETRRPACGILFAEWDAVEGAPHASGIVGRIWGAQKSGGRMSPATTVRIKQVFAAIGTILALVTAFQTPPQGVPQPTMYAIGISIWAVFWLSLIHI